MTTFNYRRNQCSIHKNTIKICKNFGLPCESIFSTPFAPIPPTNPLFSDQSSFITFYGATPVSQQKKYHKFREAIGIPPLGSVGLVKTKPVDDKYRPGLLPANYGVTYLKTFRPWRILRNLYRKDYCLQYFSSET